MVAPGPAQERRDLLDRVWQKRVSFETGAMAVPAAVNGLASANWETEEIDGPKAVGNIFFSSQGTKSRSKTPSIPPRAVKSFFYRPHPGAAAVTTGSRRVRAPLLFDIVKKIRAARSGPIWPCPSASRENNEYSI